MIDLNQFLTTALVIKTFHSFEGSEVNLSPLLEQPSAFAGIVGGAFTPEMIQAARQWPNSERVPWLQDNKFKRAEEWQAMTAEQLATDFVDRVKICLRSNGVVPGCETGTGAGALWLY